MLCSASQQQHQQMPSHKITETATVDEKDGSYTDIITKTDQLMNHSFLSIPSMLSNASTAMSQLTTELQNKIEIRCPQNQEGVYAKESTAAQKNKNSKLPQLLKRLWTTILMGDEDRFISTCTRITADYGERKLSESPLNKFGWTALHAACYYGRLSFVKYLIAKGKVSPNV